MCVSMCGHAWVGDTHATVCQKSEDSLQYFPPSRIRIPKMELRIVVSTAAEEPSHEPSFHILKEWKKDKQEE